MKCIAFRKYLYCFFVATLSFLTPGRSFSSYHSHTEFLHMSALLYVEDTISLYLFTASAPFILLYDHLWALEGCAR